MDGPMYGRQRCPTADKEAMTYITGLGRNSIASVPSETISMIARPVNEWLNVRNTPTWT